MALGDPSPDVEPVQRQNSELLANLIWHRPPFLLTAPSTIGRWWLIGGYALLFAAGLLALRSNVYAQTFDPYARITDPRAIARLDNLDSGDLHYRCGVGWPSERDSDQYFILASDSGHAGIITHLWNELHQQPDSTTWLKIVIDGSVLINEHLYSFYQKTHGAVRQPLDSLASGGLVCDVQIPFRHSFSIRYYAPWTTCCLFWAIAYRYIGDSNLVESFHLTPSTKLLAEQAAAEQKLEQGGSPWSGGASSSLLVSAPLTPEQTTVLADLTGPGMITTLQITPTGFDSVTMRGLRLQMFWDNSPFPSVDVPLPDFFGSGSGPRELHAFSMQATLASEFTSFFPMPYHVHALIRIVNGSPTAGSVTGSVSYSNEQIDRDQYGYFAAQFNESNPTLYHVYHRVGRMMGRGRYIGMHLMLNPFVDPYYLEGDPIIEIDSDDSYHIRYTGGEDYFSGGWFFEDGNYSLPFAGCTSRWNTTYRFHYLDAIEFHKSFTFDFEHGVSNDYRAHYRTVAFFYQHWTPFWPSRDSVLSGEQLRVSGSGYLPNESIAGKLGSVVLFSTRADAAGNFSTVATISGITTGPKLLSVNGEVRPEPITVLANPALYFSIDTAIHVLHWKDSVWVTGTGFDPGEHVSFSIGGKFAKSEPLVIADSDYSFGTLIFIPWLADGDYAIQAQGDAGHTATSQSLLHVTRTLNIECERMWPPLVSDAYSRVDYMGYFHQYFSEQYYVLFVPDKAGESLQLPFSVPVSDTFKVTYFGTYSPRFANYRIGVDGAPAVSFIGFQDRDPADPIRSAPIDLGTLYLTAGPHTLSFLCTGWDSHATDHLLGADNLVLTPATAMHAIPDSVLEVPARIDTTFSPDMFGLWPNPLTLEDLHLSFDLRGVRLDSGTHLSLVLYDVLGRVVGNIFDHDVIATSYFLNVPTFGLPNGNYFCVGRISSARSASSFVKGIEILR